MNESERDLLQTKLNDRCDWIRDVLHSVGIDPLIVQAHEDGVNGVWHDQTRMREINPEGN